MAHLIVELPEQVTQGQMVQALDQLGCDLRLSGDGRNYIAVPREARATTRTVNRQQEKEAVA